MAITTNPLTKGYLTSEFQVLAAHAVISYGILFRVLSDLSSQTSFMTKHPAIAAVVSSVLIANTAVQSIFYTLGRSNVKAAEASTPTAQG